VGNAIRKEAIGQTLVQPAVVEDSDSQEDTIKASKLPTISRKLAVKF